MERNEPVTINVVVREDNPQKKAIHIWDRTRNSNGEENRVYIPRSQIQAREVQENGTTNLTIPYWLADNEGLI